MSEATTEEGGLKRDRAMVLEALAYIIALAWRMPRLQAWGATEVLLTWVMWTVMMVAMMTPSAAP
jgi:predicted metal-binding membrane protein